MAINLNGTTGITTTGLTSNGIDDNATSTAMTLDSSGNLLVGKTSSSASVAGFMVEPEGDTYITVEGVEGRVLYLNRLSSDGDIIQLAKDGPTVGSIGTYNDYMTVGSGDTGLLMYNGGDVIRPHNMSSNTARDNAIDLGSTSDRFKDAYLSGGVYLGGTGSSNKLDDYEEGSWTPAITGITVTSGTFNGFYRKIGGLVSLTMRMDNCTLTGSGSTITGLPFTCNLRTSSSGPVTYNHPNGDKPLGILIEGGTPNAYLQYNTTGAWVGAPFTAGPNRYIAVQMTYTTNE